MYYRWVLEFYWECHSVGRTQSETDNGLKVTHLVFFVQLSVFLALVVGSASPWRQSLIDTFGVSTADAALSQPWSLVSYLFLNAHPIDFVLGGGILLLVGVPVERRLGSRRFLGLYLLAGLLTGVAHVFLVEVGVVSGQLLLGSVGASAGLLTAYLFLLGRDRLVGSLPFPVFYVLVACGLFAALALVVYDNDEALNEKRTTLIERAAGPGASVDAKVTAVMAVGALDNKRTDELGHMLGLVLGALALFLVALISRTGERYRVGREIRGLQEEVDARAQVELLLEKITGEGLSSLSRHERKFLRYASRFYKPSSRLSKLG